MKKLCITGAILMVAGIILSALGLGLVGEDTQSIFKSKLTEKTIEVGEDFSNIQINTDTTDVVFSLSEDGSCRILCRETEQQPHTAKVENGTLFIKQENDREWYHYIGFHFEIPSVEIQLPKAAFESLTLEGDTGDVVIPETLTFADVKIDSDTGDVDVRSQVEKTLCIELSTGRILVSGVNCEQIDLQTSTGDIHFTRGSCKNLTTVSDTGRQTMENVVASGDVRMVSDTGDIRLADFDGATISITTDTGDVTGTILTEKIFFAETDTGRVKVPRCTSGGSCEITTDTGDIILQLA